jgi:hypothetical protein
MQFSTVARQPKERVAPAIFAGIVSIGFDAKSAELPSLSLFERERNLVTGINALLLKDAANGGSVVV